MTALPTEFATRMAALPHLDVDALIAALEAPPVRGGRVNPNRFETIDALAMVLGVPLSASPWHPDGFVIADEHQLGPHPLHAAGAFYLQEPSATLPAVVLDAQPGETVLDLCAAPGGKTTAIAAAMRGAGVIVANEIHPKRARALCATLDRWGNANTIVTNDPPARLASQLRQAFDRVLVDAPCSGEGLFRRDVAARGEWSERAVSGCARRQTEILNDAAALVQPGGVLVYSTCTFEEAENEGVVRAFLTAHPDWELDPVALIGGAVEGTLAGTARVYPHLASGEGQFVAKLRAPAGSRRKLRAAAGRRPNRDEADAWRAFEAEALRAFDLPGPLTVAGTNLIAAAPALPLGGLTVLRAGLPLGHRPHRHFEPFTALAHVLRPEHAAQTVELAGEELDLYLRGEPIERPAAGWPVITVAGIPLGWGRAQRGVIRSKFPASWRQWVRAPHAER